MTASLAKWPGALLALLAVAAHDAARPKVAFQSVSAGASHTCGIATGGLAYCWGDNTAGELGTGDGRSHRRPAAVTGDRKSTRLNSSHSQISYAVFCLKKKNS